MQWENSSQVGQENFPKISKRTAFCENLFALGERYQTKKGGGGTPLIINLLLYLNRLGHCFWSSRSQHLTIFVYNHPLDLRPQTTQLGFDIFIATI
jgi:hypothetical protein